MAEIERRILQSTVRAERDKADAPRITGHAAIFGARSENLGGFREIILKGAFDDVLSQDVRALFNHNNDKVLGRTSAGTAAIGVDERGLWYEISPPDTSYVRDLLVLLERGEVTQSSFAFSIDRDGDSWGEDGDGVLIREVRKVSRLYDVSPVTYPAYPQTDAAKRSMREYLESRRCGLTAEQRDSLLRAMMVSAGLR